MREIGMKDGKLFWITGLSGAGKTTIGMALYEKISLYNNNVLFLDGDILKKILEDPQNVDYTFEGRKKRAMKYAKLCEWLVSQGMIVVCCTISMFDKVRQYNREHIQKYVEIFLDVPIEVLFERDQKGLYSKYRNGEDVDIAGLSVGIEFPKCSDVVICNDGSISVESCVEKILKCKEKEN